MRGFQIWAQNSNRIAVDAPFGKNGRKLAKYPVLPDPLVQNRDDIRTPHLQEYFHRNYAHHPLFMNQYIIFLPLTLLRRNVSPTSNPVIENEFVYIGSGSLGFREFG